MVFYTYSGFHGDSMVIYHLLLLFSRLDKVPDHSMRSHRCPGNKVGRGARGSTIILVIIISSIMAVAMVLLGIITPTPEKDNLFSLCCRKLFQFWVMLRVLFLLPEVKINAFSL